ncbi:unnamed protein product [Ostreobium quekettii]|uniref:Uncharacterized protein n=1 Tax=Ostreobium quekettii TaxID=121088 RepID=A0A8S1IVT3_9CHLO|nr:unnamed protein product [Ostreobium quekettii]|eukprot:evm.model.scf_167.9 EVM.evm.TU.scf_167.9   scf_167:67700-68746(+)
MPPPPPPPLLSYSEGTAAHLVQYPVSQEYHWPWAMAHSATAVKGIPSTPFPMPPPPPPRPPPFLAPPPPPPLFPYGHAMPTAARPHEGLSHAAASTPGSNSTAGRLGRTSDHGRSSTPQANGFPIHTSSGEHLVGSHTDDGHLHGLLLAWYWAGYQAGIYSAHRLPRPPSG